jgi:pimeloyl-ACP methyl ester carboxylesterase
MSKQKSTNVRFQATRLGMAVLGEIAPSLAARAAARLFLTPPRSRTRNRDGRALSQAEPFAVRVGSSTLRCWRFGEGPAVLLVHGWGGRAGQLAALAAALEERGCAAVTFDGPAHGASSGRVASVPEFAEAASAVARHAGARGAIGHSMGAAALALAMLRGASFDAAVFVGPPKNPAGFYEPFCRALGLGARVRDMARRRLERRVGMSFEELDLTRMGRRVATPLLVIHDRADEEVAWADGAAVAQAWPGGRLATTDGLGHRRILRDARAVADAAGFVAERLERCGCGRYACGASGALRLCDGCLLAAEMFERPGRWN